LIDILNFDTLIEYQRSKTLIIFDNLQSVYIDDDIIINFLKDDLILKRVLLINFIKFFICSSLELASKNDEEYKHIHHLSHFSRRLVNDFFSELEELKYIIFQKILDIIINVKRHFFIIKRDIRDAFRNVFVVDQSQ
jgi:hypothetical protein